MDEGLKNLGLLRRKIVEKRYDIKLKDGDVVHFLKEKDGILFFGLREDIEGSPHTLMHAYNSNNGKHTKSMMSLEVIHDLSSMHGVAVEKMAYDTLVYEVT